MCVRQRVCVTRLYVLASQCVPYCPARHLLTAVCESVPTAVPARISVTGTEESRQSSLQWTQHNFRLHEPADPLPAISIYLSIYISIYLYISVAGKMTETSFQFENYLTGS